MVPKQTRAQSHFDETRTQQSCGKVCVFSYCSGLLASSNGDFRVVAFRFPEALAFQTLEGLGFKAVVWGFLSQMGQAPGFILGTHKTKPTTISTMITPTELEAGDLLTCTEQGSGFELPQYKSQWEGIL